MTQTLTRDYTNLSLIPSLYERIQPVKRVPLYGFKAKLIRHVDSSTVRVKSNSPTQYNVYFKDISMGQVRLINGQWGWRTQRHDYLHDTKESAAQAFAKWILQYFWAENYPRFAHLEGSI